MIYFVLIRVLVYFLTGSQYLSELLPAVKLEAGEKLLLWGVTLSLGKTF
jgi:hypothetical protein